MSSSVFISHRRSDDAGAERLATTLRAAGHDVWLDVWNIGLGDSIVERMNEGLDRAAYVVLCYSDAGVTSPWMSREWMAGLARQLNGAGAKLLPVRLSGGEPPALLADVRFADLVKDWDEGVSELLRALR